MLNSNFFNVEINLTTIGTFAAGFVPFVVSLVTYKVAKTQRDISANQYKLDLYIKRREVFDSLHDWYKKNNRTDFKFDKLIELQSIISNIEILFSINNNEIKSEIVNLIKLDTDLSSFLFVFSGDDIQKESEYRKIEEDIIMYWWELLDGMEFYYETVKEALKVPQNPY